MRFCGVHSGTETSDLFHAVCDFLNLGLKGLKEAEQGNLIHLGADGCRVAIAVEERHRTPTEVTTTMLHIETLRDLIVRHVGVAEAKSLRRFLQSLARTQSPAHAVSP